MFVLVDCLGRGGSRRATRPVSNLGVILVIIHHGRHDYYHHDHRLHHHRHDQQQQQQERCSGSESVGDSLEMVDLSVDTDTTDGETGPHSFPPPSRRQRSRDRDKHLSKPHRRSNRHVGHKERQRAALMRGRSPGRHSALERSLERSVGRRRDTHSEEGFLEPLVDGCVGAPQRRGNLAGSQRHLEVGSSGERYQVLPAARSVDWSANPSAYRGAHRSTDFFGISSLHHSVDGAASLSDFRGHYPTQGHGKDRRPFGERSTSRPECTGSFADYFRDRSEERLTDDRDQDLRKHRLSRHSRSPSPPQR